jgi:hypothetical protein
VHTSNTTQHTSNPAQHNSKQAQHTTEGNYTATSHLYAHEYAAQSAIPQPHQEMPTGHPAQHSPAQHNLEGSYTATSLQPDTLHVHILSPELHFYNTYLHVHQNAAQRSITQPPPKSAHQQPNAAEAAFQATSACDPAAFQFSSKKHTHATSHFGN